MMAWADSEVQAQTRAIVINTHYPLPTSCLPCFLEHHNTQQRVHKSYGTVSPNSAEVTGGQARYLHNRDRRVGRS